jgi:putative hemolysin
MRTELALVAVLVLVNAVFAGSEAALISLREGQLRRLEQAGRRGRLVSRLARDPNRFLSTIQIVITLAGFGASAVAAVSLSQPLVGPLGFLGQAAEPVAVVVVTLVLSFFTLVLGELAPKRLALQRTEQWAKLVTPIIIVIAVLTRPVVWLLSQATDLAVRLAGGDPRAQREEVSADELRELLARSGFLTPEHRRLLLSAFDIAERRLRHVLVPRRDVVALEADLSVVSGRDRLVATTHSRALVYSDGIDDVIGLVHLADLVQGTGTVRDHVRPVVVLPDTTRLLDALRRLQAKRQQLALVVNEYGATAGMVTLEDLLEELVGDISDEFDQNLLSVQRRPDGSLLIPGTYPLHDLQDLGWTPPSGQFTTVAGLVLNRLGRVPQSGEWLEVDDWRIEVVLASERSIGRVVWCRPGRIAHSRGPESSLALSGWPRRGAPATRPAAPFSASGSGGRSRGRVERSHLRHR